MTSSHRTRDAQTESHGHGALLMPNLHTPDVKVDYRGEREHVEKKPGNEVPQASTTVVKKEGEGGQG